MAEENQFTDDITNFSMAFEAAAAEEPSKAAAEEPPKAAAEEPPKVTAEEPPKVTAEESPQVTAEEPPKVTAEESPQVTAEEPPKVTKEKSLSADDIKAIAAKAAADKAEADRIAAEEKAAAEKVAADRAAAEKPTKEEQALLDDVIENFPEVSKALDIVQRITMSKVDSIVEKRMSALLSQLNQQLAPVFATTQTVANNAHEQAILNKHSDAFDIIDAVGSWVDKQPPILQTTYKDVLEKGTADQVIQLLDLYKESTKPVTPKESAAEVEKKKAKLAAQEGVTSRQAPTRETLDPNDFSGAFNKYSQQV